MESCGARDDSASWNLVREKVETIRVDGTGPLGRGHEDVKEIREGGASECSKVKYRTKPLSGMQQPGEGAASCRTEDNDASVTRLPGNDESSENNPISEEEWLIGGRCIDEERSVEETSLSDDVAECVGVTVQTSDAAARTCRFR